MIHSEYGYTVKDCRTEQRQRWDKIRYDERMKIEKKGREETVARRRERSRKKRAHKETQWLNSAEQAAEPVKALPDRYLVKALQDELHYSKDNHEAKKKRAAHTGRALALKNLKSQLKKTNRELRAAEKLIGLMGGKGYSLAMSDFFTSQVNEVKTKYHAHHASYVEAMSEIVLTPWWGELRLQNSKESLEKIVEALQSELKAFKDGVAVPVKNLMGLRGARAAPPF